MDATLIERNSAGWFRRINELVQKPFGTVGDQLDCDISSSELVQKSARTSETILCKNPNLFERVYLNYIFGETTGLRLFFKIKQKQKNGPRF